MDSSARLSSKGQVTLPKGVRDALGLEQGDRLHFRVVDGWAVMSRWPDLLELGGSVPVPSNTRSASWPEIRSAAWKRATTKS